MQSDKPQDEPDLQLSRELTDFARSLGDFKARSLAIDRDRVMFEAGRTAGRNEFLSSTTSVQRLLRQWQSGAVALAAVSASLVAMLVVRPDPEPRIVFVDRDQAVAAPAIEVVHESPDLDQPELATKSPSSVAMIPAERQEIDDGVAGSLDLIHARQTAVSQLLGSGLAGDEPRSRTVSSIRNGPEESVRSPWNPRVLMFNHGSKNWMNRLIEEPTL